MTTLQQRAASARYRKRHPEKVREYQKRWWIENPDYNSKWKREHKESVNASQLKRRRNHPEKVSANKKVEYAIKIGKLIKFPCAVCGDPKSEAHHPDYAKPLEVQWLCKCHHIDAHLEEKRQWGLML